MVKKENEMKKLIEKLKKYDDLEEYPQDKELELEKIRDKLVSIGKPAVLELITVLNNHDSWSCSFAAEALGDIGDKRAIEPLIEALNKWELGEVATVSLKKFGTTCIPHMIQKLRDIIAKSSKNRERTDRLISNALWVIGDIQCKESSTFLIELLDDYVNHMPKKNFDMSKHNWKYKHFDFFLMLDCMVRQQNKKAIPSIKKASDCFPENYVDYKICQIAMGRIKKGRAEGCLPLEALEIMMPSGAIMNALSGGEFGWKDTFDEKYGEYFEEEDE